MFDVNAIRATMTLNNTSFLTGIKGSVNAVKDASAEMRSSLGACGSSVSSLLSTIAAGTAGLATFGTMLNDAIGAQKINKMFAKSFGESTQSMRQWVDDITGSLGLEDDALMGIATKFNTMFKQMGMGSESAKEMSKNFTQLAYDMSVKFGTPEDAMSALDMAMKGVGRSMKQYNIILDEERLQEEATALGIKKKVSDMTSAETVAMKYLAVMKNSTGVQNLLANSTDLVSVQTFLFKEQLGALSDELGAALLPSFSRYTQGMTGIVKGVREWARVNPDVAATLVKVAAAVSGLLIGMGALSGAIWAIGPAFTALGKVAASSWGAMFTPAGAVVFALAGIGLAVYALRAEWNQNINDMKKTFGGLADVVESAASKIGGFLSKVNDKLQITQRLYSGINQAMSRPGALAKTGWSLFTANDGGAVFGLTKESLKRSLNVWTTTLNADMLGGLAKVGGNVANFLAGGVKDATKASVDQAKEDTSGFFNWLETKIPGISKMLNYSTLSFDELMKGSDKSKAGLGAAGAEADKLKEAGAELYKQLSVIGNVSFDTFNDGLLQGAQSLATLQENMGKLNAAGALNDQSRGMLGVQFWKDIKDLVPSTIDTIVSKIGDASIRSQVQSYADAAARIREHAAALEIDKKFMQEEIDAAQQLKENQMQAYQQTTTGSMFSSMGNQITQMSGYLSNNALSSNQQTMGIAGILSQFTQLHGSALQIQQDLQMISPELAAAFGGAAQAELDNLIRKLEEMPQVGKEAADEVRRALANIATKKSREEMKQLLQTVSGTANAFEEFGNTIKSKALSVVGKLTSGVAQIADTFMTMKNSAAEMSVSVIKSLMNVLSWAQMIISALQLIASLFGFMGDEGTKELTGMKAVIQDIKDSANDWIDQMTEKIVDFAMTGKAAFGELFDYIGREIAQIAVKNLIVMPMAKTIGSLLGMASGGVVSGGRVVPFADGGILSGPTLFPMANGSAVLAGEAGAEAFLPLERMKNGKLGVGASGNATTVNIIDQRAANAAPVQVSESTVDGQRVITVLVRDVVKGLLSNGEFDTQMRAYGLRRVPV